MNIVRFQPDHLKLIEIQDSQLYLMRMTVKPEYGIGLSLAGPAFSAFDGETLLGCGGAIEHSRTRAEIWALLSKHIGPHMRTITRAVNGWLDVCGYLRVEANVATDFEPGKRWIKLLGFHQECEEKRLFMPDGRSAIGFVRFP